MSSVHLEVTLRSCHRFPPINSLWWRAPGRWRVLEHVVREGTLHQVLFIQPNSTSSAPSPLLINFE